MNMVFQSRIWFFLKFGFLLTLVCGMFLTIFPVLRLRNEYTTEEDLDVYVENLTQPYMGVQYTLDQLQENAPACLKMWRNSFETKSLSAAGDKSFYKTSSKGFYKSLKKFHDLLKIFNVKIAIIEPLILHCMLQPSHKSLLRERPFNLSKYEGSYNALTYGIRQEDAYKLQQEAIVSKFKKAGFSSSIAFTRLTDWMQKTDSMLWLQKPPGHLFYTHQNHTFHLVVFYGRRNYLWHSAMGVKERDKIPVRADWLFASENSAYEKFSFIPLRLEEPPVEVHIPSSPQYFLFQMLSSKFLECDVSRAVNLTKNVTKVHSSLSVEEFDLRTFIAIHQLKAIFQPLLMNLWIWSGTMLGWYRQCDIIPYTTDADFAAWVHEVHDLDALIDQLRNNQYITIQSRMGMLSEALEFALTCKRLRVDIFFVYLTTNGSWYSGHTPSQGYYFRYYNPPFSLCSGELLGEKVQVPCQTEKVIVNEYGPDWSKPVSSWNYRSSIKNRGPNIYWSKKYLKDVHEVY